ncbi:MAG: DUF3035 domain-containing protein [Acetobacteraceae bacterium]
MAFRDSATTVPFVTCATLLASISLGGCTMLNRDPPDAFAVTTRPPLVIPSDFSLPPPRPGMENPHEQSPRLQAEAVLVPEVELSGDKGPDSPGQRALVRAAGPPPPPNIRHLVDKEGSGDSSAGIADSLLFWKSTPPPGQPLDPQREAARLHERSAPAPATGPGVSASPANNKSSGLLDWLF